MASNSNDIISQLIFINELLTRNLWLSGINTLINNSSNILPPLIYTKNSNLISNNAGFHRAESVSSSESTNLFTNTDNNFALIEHEANFIKVKRYKKRRPRKENKDNILKKIKRGFFNGALLKKLNNKLRSFGSKKYLERFPQYLVSDVNKKRNKEILGLTLQEIFEKKELYNLENGKGLSNYIHNLKVLQSEEIKENEEFKEIMNKTFRELFEEYINSDEFKVEEINRIKKKNEDEYMRRYIYLAKHFIEFFSKWIQSFKNLF